MALRPLLWHIIPKQVQLIFELMETL